MERVAPGERQYGGGWGTTAETQTPSPEREDQQVTPLEVFFDLVLVFAITQVTGFISADPTWTRLVEGLAILAALWSSSGCAPRGARSTIAAFVQAA